MTDFPAVLVERVARALCEYALNGKRCPCKDKPFRCADETPGSYARAALSALPAAVQAVARGEAVAVPREPTIHMLLAAGRVAIATPDGTWMVSRDEARRVWTYMLAASPHTQEPQR